MVAYLDATGRPTTVLNSTGDLLTPSAVFFDDDGIVVGKEAVKSCALAPDAYAECFKRDMGSVHVPPQGPRRAKCRRRCSAPSSWSA